MWGKVSCLRKQHDGRDWALIHRHSDLKSNVLTTTETTTPPTTNTLAKVLQLGFYVVTKTGIYTKDETVNGQMDNIKSKLLFTF